MTYPAEPGDILTWNWMTKGPFDVGHAGIVAEVNDNEPMIVHAQGDAFKVSYGLNNRDDYTDRFRWAFRCRHRFIGIEAAKVAQAWATTQRDPNSISNTHLTGGNPNDYGDFIAVMPGYSMGRAFKSAFRSASYEDKAGKAKARAAEYREHKYDINGPPSFRQRRSGAESGAFCSMLCVAVYQAACNEGLTQLVMALNAKNTTPMDLIKYLRRNHRWQQYRVR